MAEKAKKVAPMKNSAWNEKRTIFLDRKPKGEKNFEVAGVNGKVYQVPCGKQIEVPLPIYEVLMRQKEMRNRLIDVQESIPNEI